ncbi:hypothetical protein [Nitrosopumilus ureiphilus]|uniref:Uncharacterized protein n=1 Tax=Nitrosopumilus ureiphilus TaxID=1470067 RepID=A0A7D5R351_9ARCH|nr:hypothetical protein [Nitrosopumilus ureiphilus]QLH06740.1 hypothetical protein C5F50_06365 [Nitrosopumilus ureiphilus]
MNKSLGDYNIEKSSSRNIRNIVWTMKNPVNAEKSKNKRINSDKKFQNSSFTNIIYDYKPKIKSHAEKIFKIEKIHFAEKSKNKRINSDKKFQNSSASNCNIKQGFKRPGR